MRRATWMVVCLVALSSLLGCRIHYKVPTGPPPAPTPTPTPGCYDVATLPTVTGSTGGSSWWVGPIPVATLTGTPTPTPKAWSGELPPHSGEYFTLKTRADWDNYVATSNYPSDPAPIPFNPSTQMLLVITGASGSCAGSTSFESVCWDGAQITVITGTHQGCCGTPPPFWWSNSLGVLVPQSPLPVVWTNNYYPLPPGLLCM